MGLYLPHRVQQNADNDQNTSSAKEPGSRSRHTKQDNHRFRNHSDDRQEKCTSKGEPSQRKLEKISGGLAWTITWNVTIILLQVVGDLGWLELNCHPEIAEEKDQHGGHGVVQPATG